MIHLRLIVPAGRSEQIVAYLEDAPGVAHLIRLPGAASRPSGDVLLCDVTREAVDEVVEWLQRRDVHHDGCIVVDPVATVISDAAAAAEQAAPGAPGEALIWEELEARAREEAALTPSYLVFIVVAAVIAAVGILLDAPILIVGAMVVGPEYGPIAAMCVAAARRRAAGVALAARTLLGGLAAAAGLALVATSTFRATGLAPEDYGLSDRQLTSFIAHPDGLAAVVAVLAGIVGMLSFTQARPSALVGVLVSVTTIPAAANIGVAASYGEWADARGAAAQLAINVAGLAVAGITTLLVQHRLTRPAPTTT